MRRVFNLFISFLSLLIFLSIQFSSTILASAPYEASDVLGHTDKYGNISFDANYEGTPSSYGFNNIYGVVIDYADHRMFIADTRNQRILVFNLNSNDELIDYDADYVLGQPNMNSRTSHCEGSLTVNNSNFCYPGPLAFDSTTQYLYVSDAENNRILVFDTSLEISNGMSASYVIGQQDFTSFHSLGNTDKTFSYRGASALAIDEVGQRLFAAASSGGRLLIFDISSLQNYMSASNILGQADFTSSGADTNAKGFTNPTGLVYDPNLNYLYVSDAGEVYVGSGSSGGAAGNRILVFDVSSITDNEDAINVLGQTNFTTGTADTNIKGFDTPQALALDDSNNLYAIDIHNNRILVFNTLSLSNNMDASYVIGQTDFVIGSADYNFTADTFYPNGLRDVTYNTSSHSILVSDLNRILEFDVDNLSNGMSAFNVIGQSDEDGNQVFTTNYANNEIYPTARTFDGSYAVAFDTVHHRLFASDRWGYRILVFNLNDSNEIVDKTADFVIGQPNFTSQDYGTSINQFVNPFGIAYDSTYERLFVADKGNNRVMVFDVSVGNLTNSMDASFVIGQPNFGVSDCNQGETDPTDKSLCQPFDVAIDPDRQVMYVADKDNSRVVEFDVSPENIENNMSAVRVFGQADFSGKDCNRGDVVSINTLCNPRGVDVNPLTHQLYIADAQGGLTNRVLIFDYVVGDTLNGPDATYVLGQPDFVTGDEGTSINSLTNPHDIAVNYDQNILFVNDENNCRIMVFDINEISNGEDAIGVIGQPDFNTSSCNSASQTSFEYATGIAINPSTHDVFIGDSYENYRYLIFNFVKLPSSITNPTQGSSFSQSLTATQSQGTISYTVSSGMLPSGLVLDSATGLLSGTPATSGIFTFTIKATDDNGAIGNFFDTHVYTVTVATRGSSTSSPRPEGEYSTTEVPVCNTPKPEGTPTLFQVIRGTPTYSDVTLHFTPTTDNTTYYLISYGVTSEAEGYSVQLDQPSDTSGAISYPIHNLSPHTSYYFKVRNGNNCQPGSWSEIKKDTNTYSYPSSLTSQQTSDEDTTDTKQDDKSQSTNSLKSKQTTSKDTNNQQLQDNTNINTNTDTSSNNQNNQSTPWYQALWSWLSSWILK